MFDPALHKAVKQGNVNTIIDLVNHGADINAKDFHQNTPLHAAIFLENEEIAELLLNLDADLNIKNKDGETPLQFALLEQSLDMVKVLINAGADPNCKDSGGLTALHLAIKQNDVAFIKSLLLREVDVNVEDSNKETPLSLAFDHPGSIEIVKMLVDAGADVNFLNRWKQTLLHVAAENNYVSHIEFLLSQGVDVNVKDSSNRTALHCLVIESKNDSWIRAAEILLKNGANVDTLDHLRNTPLQDAIKKGSLGLVQLLLNFKADLITADNEGNVPLMMAIIKGNVEIVRLLLSTGTNVNYINTKNGFRPLHYACAKGIEITQLLLIYGARVDCINTKNGATPLHDMCLKGNIEMIKYLLNNGAKIDALDFEGNTPLFNSYNSFYTIDNFKKMLKFLLKYANVNVINRAGRNILFLVGMFKDSRKAVLEHLAKLKTLDISVHPSLLATISENQKYRDHFEKCNKELQLAKITKFPNSWVSFFNLMVDGKRRLKNFAGNKDLVKNFKNSEYRKTFPIYADFIHENMNKGIRRRELFDRSTVLLSDCLPIFNPNHLVITDILDCTSTKNLSKFNE